MAIELLTSALLMDSICTECKEGEIGEDGACEKCGAVAEESAEEDEDEVEGFGDEEV